MRTLARNKQLIYYSLYESKTEMTDQYGNLIGAYKISYTKPMPMMINVSPARGISDVEQFGISESYTKTMVTDDMKCPLKEGSILWLEMGEIPTFNDGSLYSIGDKVIYQDSIYECVSDTTGDFTPASWEIVKHNYVITKVAKSLNSILYAIKGVEVT